MLTESNHKETVLATRLTSEISKLVVDVAGIQGLNPAEYLRNLVLMDLEKRSLITTKIDGLKQEMKQSQSAFLEKKITQEA
jgi:hypothetical protein